MPDASGTATPGGALRAPVAGWVETAVFWHVYPLGFVGAPIRGGYSPTSVARLDRVTGWLDYLIALGCNGLLLGPVFASETHGYDTLDHLRVDPRLGDEHDLDALMRAARARGVRVVLDGVFNHVGRGFPRFQAALAGDAAAAAWFPAADDGPVVFEGHSGLIELNHANPAVRDYVVEVMCHWLERGISGWRLDAAYAAPVEFWAEVTQRVRARYPEVWFLGEVIHGDYGAFARASGIESITQYELWKAIWSALQDRNLFELAYALGRHLDFARAELPQTFVGNHDVTRYASQIADERHLGHGLAVLFTVPGVPSIYAGDEQGLRALKTERIGGDDAIRPEFPRTPGLLAGGNAMTLRDHQRLVGLRRRCPWLVGARLEAIHVANESLVYRARDPAGTARLVTALNLGDQPLNLGALPPSPTAASAAGLVAGSLPDVGRLTILAAPETRDALEPVSVVGPHHWAVLAEG